MVDNVLTLVSESVVFTQQFPDGLSKLSPGHWMKQHPVVPLGGIVVGSGLLPTLNSEPSPKKTRKSSSMEPKKNVMVALNSYKAIHTKLVDQFERKTFAH
jgi:hypothetical protein